MVCTVFPGSPAPFPSNGRTYTDSVLQPSCHPLPMCLYWSILVSWPSVYSPIPEFCPAGFPCLRLLPFRSRPLRPMCTALPHIRFGSPACQVYCWDIHSFDVLNRLALHLSATMASADFSQFVVTTANTKRKGPLKPFPNFSSPYPQIFRIASCVLLPGRQPQFPSASLRQAWYKAPAHTFPDRSALQYRPFDHSGGDGGSRRRTAAARCIHCIISFSPTGRRSS